MPQQYSSVYEDQLAKETQMQVTSEIGEQESVILKGRQHFKDKIVKCDKCFLIVEDSDLIFGISKCMLSVIITKLFYKAI